MDSIVEDAIGEAEEDGEASAGEPASAGSNGTSADVKGSGTMTDDELASVVKEDRKSVV